MHPSLAAHVEQRVESSLRRRQLGELSSVLCQHCHCVALRERSYYLPDGSCGLMHQELGYFVLWALQALRLAEQKSRLCGWLRWQESSTARPLELALGPAAVHPEPLSMQTDFELAESSRTQTRRPGLTLEMAQD